MKKTLLKIFALSLVVIITPSSYGMTDEDFEEKIEQKQEEQEKEREELNNFDFISEIESAGKTGDLLGVLKTPDINQLKNNLNLLIKYNKKKKLTKVLEKIQKTLFPVPALQNKRWYFKKNHIQRFNDLKDFLEKLSENLNRFNKNDYDKISVILNKIIDNMNDSKLTKKLKENLQNESAKRIKKEAKTILKEQKRLKKEQEEKERLEAEQKKKAEEEEQLKKGQAEKEEQERQKQEAEQKKKTEEEKQAQKEEQAEAKRKVEEEERLKKEKEEQKRQEQEAEQKKKTEKEKQAQKEEQAEAKRKVEEEERLQKEKEEQKRQEQEAEQKKKAEEEEQLKKEQEEKERQEAEKEAIAPEELQQSLSILEIELTALNSLLPKKQKLEHVTKDRPKGPSGRRPPTKTKGMGSSEQKQNKPHKAPKPERQPEGFAPHEKL